MPPQPTFAKYSVSDGANLSLVLPRQYEGTIVTVAAAATAVDRNLRRVCFFIFLLSDDVHELQVAYYRGVTILQGSDQRILIGPGCQ